MAWGLGDAIYAQLRDMEQGGVELELIREGELLRGRFRQVSHMMTINDKRGRPQTVTVVQFQGRRVNLSAIGAGAQPLGIAQLGTAFLG